MLSNKTADCLSTGYCFYSKKIYIRRTDTMDAAQTPKTNEHVDEHLKQSKSFAKSSGRAVYTLYSLCKSVRGKAGE